MSKQRFRQLMCSPKVLFKKQKHQDQVTNRCKACGSHVLSLIVFSSATYNSVKTGQF